VANREKVTVSLYDEDLIRIEKLKKHLCNNNIAFLPTTSEVVRIALLLMTNTSLVELQEAVERLPSRKGGRPKQQKA
jgi:hypothetical protein